MNPYKIKFDNFLNKKNMDPLGVFSQISKATEPGSDWQFNNDGYLILKNFKDNEIKNEELPFEYRINKHGYRSNNFIEFDQDKIGILFSGCSHTFGEGLPNESIWPTILEEKLSLNSQSYNLGVGGASIHLIIKNLYSFIRNYGKPKYIFLVLPAISRSIKYDKDLSIYRNILAHSHKKYKKFLKNFIYEDNVLLATTLIFMLEDYCKEAGINLYWTTWSHEDLDIYDKLDFNNYIYFDSDSLNSMVDNDIIKNESGMPYWKLARDNEHMGSAWQHAVSDLFMNKIQKDV